MLSARLDGNAKLRFGAPRVDRPEWLTPIGSPQKALWKCARACVCLGEWGLNVWGICLLGNTVC